MAYCSNCGTKLEDGTKLCPMCGSYQHDTQNAYVNDQSIERSSGNLNVGQLVWSIINIVLCCVPLGIAALILTILAKDSPSREEELKKIKAARTCNIIGSVSVAALVIIYVILIAVGISMSVT